MRDASRVVVFAAISAIAGCANDGRPDEPPPPDAGLTSPCAEDGSCALVGPDRDGDGIVDELDDDANGDGQRDADQRGDFDADGDPDRIDIDVDGDGIANVEELGPDGRPVDSDGDGEPDTRDLDSDGDTLTDRDESTRDYDDDGTGAWRDLDADGDGVPDAVEAGDANPATPPVECAVEDREDAADTAPDFRDADSDDDGLGDGEERALGTNPCARDTDDDGTGDLLEGVYERTVCPSPGSSPDCGCATRAECGVPPEHFSVVLPFRGEPVTRQLEFGTTIRTADVFFVTDTTGSMSGTLANVKRTVATPGTGLIARIGESIPDAWVGGGQLDDFPFGTYGALPDDRPFRLAIGMTSPSRSNEVQAAFDAMNLHSGADSPESQVEALFQIVTGEAVEWTYGGTRSSQPAYAAACGADRWGAACFRATALPIIVMFTDVCSHNGPLNEDLGACPTYEGISPSPVTWTQAVAAMRARGARFVGVNTGGATCASSARTPGGTPCWLLRRTAQETGSVDLLGQPLVYDLANGADVETFSSTVASAIETIATRVPMDVDTTLRDDLTDPDGVDATRFVARREPACSGTDTSCWTAPPEMASRDAVAAVDTSTFFAVVPGTRVRFDITFRNDFRPGGVTAQAFAAYLEVRGAGGAVLETRQVLVVVPADSRGPI